MKTFRLKHEGASKGIAMGRAHIMSQSTPVFPKYWIADKEITSEITRLKNAINKSKHQLTKVKEKLCRFQGKEHIQIIDAHTMLLQDEMLVTHAFQNVATHKINAEWALEKATSRLKLVFVEMKDEYFKQRKHDIDYIAQRIIRNLLNVPELSLYEIKEQNVILVAHDFSPADIVNFSRDRVRGFITAIGGNTSHSAIIAKSLEIPAMIGVENIFKYINENDMVVIDAVNDIVVVNPPKSEIESFKKRQSLFEKTKRELLKNADLPAITTDGHKVSLVSNIELSEEIPSAILHGAEGIGLFRTEYLFINRMDYPNEEEQFECYKKALEGMKDKPVTIRTMDLGGDKLFIGSEYEDHVNPALGLRAIRFCLVEKDIFRTQLRAMLRASVYGKLRMLLPMVSGLDELRKAKKFIQEVKEELKKEKVKISDDIEFGIMIEVPSAVVVARTLANEVDFFSIGTNDLIQYTLAVDRTNEHVAHLYNPLDPAVISMLKQTIEAAKMAGIDVTICGEVAGEPLYLPLFLGMGIDALSMNSISIPRVKKILREVTYEDAKKFFSMIEKMTSASEIETLVKGEMSKYSKILERSKP